MTSRSAAEPRADKKTPARGDLERRLFRARARTAALARPLGVEDQAAQAHEDASPTKWHLAHTTWFFETFVLEPCLPGYTTFDARFNYCFNSYYESQGERQPRPLRGLLTRPTAVEVRAYRNHIDEALHKAATSGLLHVPEIAARIELGVAHELQHQELILTDILSLFALNPLRPAYRDGTPLHEPRETREPTFVGIEGGLDQVGHEGHGFAFDNETPRHKVLVPPFKLADRLVTNGEWLEFMEDGGYRTASLWLADGWQIIQRDRWRAPLYWEERDGQWMQMTLWGLATIDRAAPVSHVSFYEADAYARWADKRLPTEFEWERAAAALPTTGNMLTQGALRPLPAPSARGLTQMFGDVWEWTRSAYVPYPGFRPASGGLGEYNAKFMCNQMVLRGASCVTPDEQARATYRNFFYPHQRWQFSGLRLAHEA